MYFLMVFFLFWCVLNFVTSIFVEKSCLRKIHFGEKSHFYNNDGRLIFEEEYLNGERNRKGKEYNNDGKLEFEGEYLN